MEAVSVARKWGSSIGFIVPKEVVRREKIKPNSKVRFEIIKVIDISDTFGKLKRKISGQEFKKRAKSGW